MKDVKKVEEQALVTRRQVKRQIIFGYTVGIIKGGQEELDYAIKEYADIAKLFIVYTKAKDGKYDCIIKTTGKTNILRVLDRFEEYVPTFTRMTRRGKGVQYKGNFRIGNLANLKKNYA